MTAMALMIQGTASHVGKSTLVTGLARLFARRGLAVRPFKPQNMSNNAAVTREGGEIGRAQALQARACGVEASVHMNPVLMKPEGERGAQIIVQGERRGNWQAGGYGNLKPSLLPKVLESFAILEAEADIVLIEGAGSAAEVNLRANDIANMGFAEATDMPVVIAADIDRGGVIANLVGTRQLLSDSEAALVKGFIINKFRGDASLFDEGIALIEQATGWSNFGVVPWFEQARLLPAEDVVGIEQKSSGDNPGGVRVAVPLYPNIANHDDLDPLALELGIDLVLVHPGEPLPGDADLVVLPGSKATIADLAQFRAAGWDVDLAGHLRRGGRVIGICGGFQMLGHVIRDPEGIEGPPGEVPGLGLLNIETELTVQKRLERVRGTHRASGAAIDGYEMHMGRTQGRDMQRSFLELAGQGEGAVSPDGRVMGTYLHGLFASDDFRRAFLLQGAKTGDQDLSYEASIDAVIDGLADHLEAALDIDSLIAIAKARQEIAGAALAKARA
jgi:adenosylcobyric acid synthase